jgi:hypothetical protein
MTVVSPTFVLFVLCVSTCSARRRAGFNSSGPATAALSYALLIACASMPLLLPVSYFAVKLHDRRQSIQTRKPESEEDGVEMQFRDAFKESRGKRAAREKIDEIPRKRNASQAADELSKACIVQVGAYGTDGEVVLATSARGCAHANVGALARQGRAADKSASWLQPSYCFRRRLPPIARAATMRACHSPNGTTGGTFACCMGAGESLQRTANGPVYGPSTGNGRIPPLARSDLTLWAAAPTRMRPWTVHGLAGQRHRRVSRTLYAVCCMLHVACCMLLYVACCMLPYVVCCMLHDAVCCMPATKWISRRSSAASSRKRSGRRRTACTKIVSTRKPASVDASSYVFLADSALSASLV